MSGEESVNDDEMSNSNDSSSNQVIQREYENAKDRLNTQREIISSLSEEGARYLRLLLIIIGVPIAVLGALGPTTLTQVGNPIVSNEPLFAAPLSLSIGSATLLSSVLLLLAVIANIAAGGNEAYNTHNISNPNDVQKAISSDRRTSEHMRMRLQEYRDRIEHNDRLIFSLDRILLFGKLFLFFSIITMSAIAYRILVGEAVSLGLLLLLLSIILLVFQIFSYVQPDKVSNRNQILRFDPVYAIEYKQKIERKESKSTSSSSEVKEEAD